MESLVDIPTLADLGYEGYETNNMAGFFYHKNVPDAAAAAFESAVESVLTDESFVTRATEAGFVPYFASGTKLDEMAHQAMETSQPVIDSLG